MGLKYTEVEEPQVRNVQMSIENVKFEQFRKEVGSGDKDFSGRTKCILFSYIIFCNTFVRVLIIIEKLIYISSSSIPDSELLGMASYSL